MKAFELNEEVMAIYSNYFYIGKITGFTKDCGGEIMAVLDNGTAHHFQFISRVV